MTDWEKKQKEHVAWLRTWEEKLDRIMPGNWSLWRDENKNIGMGDYTVVFHPFGNNERDAPKIFVRIDLDEKKLKFSATWPKDLEYNEYEPENEVRVGISLEKSPEQIRADLDRRFWPSYTLQWNAADSKRNASNVRITTQRKLFWDLCHSLDYKPGDNEKRSYALTRCGRYGISDVRIWGTDKIDILTESLPVADALKVIELLKTLRPKKNY